MISIAKQ